MIKKIRNSFVFRVGFFFKHLGRRKQLKNTIAEKLTLGEIDSLELLNLCKEKGDVKTIYDIGANIGTWAVLAKSIFSSSDIQCFEPLEIHTEKFNQNTQNIKDIKLHPVALGTSNSTEIIHITSQSDSSSLLPITKKQTEVFGIEHKKDQLVSVVSLDSYVEENNLPRPDLMKLDIQGFELEALKGASSCMKTCKFIILEISFIEFYKNQPLFEEVVSFMFSKHFRIMSFGYNTATGIEISQTDVLFRNTDLC